MLRGVRIPLAGTFRQLGVEFAIGGSRATGLMLSRRLEAGRSALRRLPHLSTYDRREQAIGTVVTPLALHGVAVALVMDPDFRGLETAVMRALWGATRLSRAKEIVFSVLSKGHRVSPVMHTRYERLLWVARAARRGSLRSSSRPPRKRAAAHLGLALWGARSKRRPPLVGALARAGGAGTSQGTSPLCTLSRSLSAKSNTGSGTDPAATPCANWRHGAQSPSRAWVTGLTAQPSARRCVWPACLRRAGLFPLWLAQGVERALLGEFLYRMYGMYLAVLAARMAAIRGDQAGHGDSLSPDQPLPRPRNPFPLDDFVGPLPGDAVRNQLRLPPGAPPGWWWPLDFVRDLVQ